MNTLSARRSSVVALLFLTVLAAINFFTHRMHWTGDEPRYTFFAASFYNTHDVSMPEETWASFQNKFGMGRFTKEELAVADAKKGHSVVFPLALAPAVGLLGVQGGRWQQVVTAGVAFFVILRLLSLHFSPGCAVGVAAFCFLSIPIQPYSRLLYSEIWLLLAVAWGWYRTAATPLSIRSLPLTLLPIFLLPFLHIRMAAVAGGIFVLLLTRLGREPGPAGHRRKLVTFTLGCAFVAAGIFVAYQMTRFGRLTGGASATAPFELSGLLYRLGVQLFEFRHGLLANNPVLLLGFVGLVLAAWRGQRLAREGIFLLVLYLPFVFGTASESMPARFWVGIMPVLIVGLGYWVAQARTGWSWIPVAPLMVVSIANVVLLVKDPNFFITNRQASLTYDYLYDHVFHRFHFGAFLPWESALMAAPNENINRTLVTIAFVAVGGFSACLLAAAAHSGRWRTLGNALATAIVSVGLFLAYTVPVNPQSFVTSVNVRPDGRHEVVVTFKDFGSPRVIRFGEPRDLWFAPNYPNEFAVESFVDPAQSWKLVEKLPTRPIIGIWSSERIKQIRIVEGNPTDGRWTKTAVSILR